MIGARILAPQSSAATARGLGPETASSSLGDTPGLEAGAAAALAPALAWLLPRQPPIAAALAAWLLAAGPWSWALFPRRIVPGVPVRGRSVALAMAPRARGRWWVRGASAQRRACAQRGTRWRGVPG